MEEEKKDFLKEKPRGTKVKKKKKSVDKQTDTRLIWQKFSF